MQQRTGQWGAYAALSIIAVALATLAFAPKARAAADGTLKLSFDQDQAGTVPTEIEVATGQWSVLADDTAPSKPNVLAQIGKGGDEPFNVCVVKGSSFMDVELGVQFKAVAGDEDQGGGLVWRYRDIRNYYICRYNPLEDDFRVYKVQNGRRSQFGRADVKATPGWHSLKVTMVGDHIECYYDGKKCLDVKDATFTAAGQVGLWSKADAQTNFDDLAAATAAEDDDKD